MKVVDLTKGPITKSLLILALPIMISNLLGMANNFIDMYWVGKLGTSELGAVGTAGLYYWLCASVILIVHLGCQVLISQAIGHKDYEKIEIYGKNAFKYGIYVALTYSLIMFFFADPLIGVFKIESITTHQMAVQYLQVLSVGIFFTMMSNVCASIFQAQGRTGLVSVYMACGILFNIILDPLFIFVLDMGVAGAAIATSLAMFIVFMLYVIKLARTTKIFHDFRPFYLDLKLVKKMTRISYPNALQNIVYTFVAMALSVLVIRYGDAAMAAQKIGNNLESFSWMIGIGITTSISVYTGQNYGARNYDRMFKGYKIMTWLMAVYGIFVMVSFVVFREQLTALFSNDPEVIAITSTYLMIVALAQFTTVIEAVACGVFNGLGQTKTPAFFSITGNIARIPLAIFLSSLMGLNGIWVAILVSCLFKGIGVFIALELELRVIKKYLRHA